MRVQAGFLQGAVALDPEQLLQRTFEVIPGLLIWSTLIGLVVLAVAQPFAIAVFLILYDLYWLIRAFYIATHLIASYRTLRRMRGINWIERLERLAAAVPVVEARVRDLAHRCTLEGDHRERRLLRRQLWQEETFLEDLRQLSQRAPPPAPLSWTDVLHVVILPSFKEPLAVLAQSIDALAATAYPLNRLWVVVALEERAGAQAWEIQRALTEKYARTFGRFLVTLHPDGMPGERKVKSANATWAGQIVQRLLDEAGIPYEHVIVSNFDADTMVAKEYFGSLTYTYFVTPDRLRCSYQPLPLYHNNIWEAPAFTRVIATNSTFWLLIECTRPERLVTYSSHAMPFRALVDAGFWDPTFVSEDSHIFWQCYLRYGGQYRTVPLYTTISMDVTNAPTLWRTFVNQYKQKRRWAWGIENFPYLARAFLKRSDIPRTERLRHLFTMLEAWHSWATAALLIAGLGWIPILFGSVAFQQTVLAFSLPRVTRTLLTVATFGLLINMTLSLLLLPPPPPRTPKRKYVWMTLQWALVPLIAWTLGSVPVLESVTRLMLGKYLGFWVTPKMREPTAVPAAVPAIGEVRVRAS